MVAQVPAMSLSHRVGSEGKKDTADTALRIADMHLSSSSSLKVSCELQHAACVAAGRGKACDEELKKCVSATDISRDTRTMHFESEQIVFRHREMLWACIRKVVGYETTYDHCLNVESCMITNEGDFRKFQKWAEKYTERPRMTTGDELIEYMRAYREGYVHASSDAIKNFNIPPGGMEHEVEGFMISVEHFMHECFKINFRAKTNFSL